MDEVSHPAKLQEAVKICGPMATKMQKQMWIPKQKKNLM